MTRRRRSNRNRRQQQRALGRHAPTLLAGALIAVSLAVVVSAQAVKHDLETERALDEASLCPLHAPIPSATLVIVDETDALAANNAELLRRLLSGIAEETERSGRLVVVPFADNMGAPFEALIDVCSPGHRNHADPLTESAHRLQARFEARFEKPLQDVLERLMGAPTANTSPIARQIERIAHSRSLGWDAPQRRLYLLSDLLENTETASVYRDGTFALPPPADRFLEGVAVTIVPLANARDGDLQTGTLEQEWRTWFEAAGATIDDGELPLGPLAEREP